MCRRGRKEAPEGGYKGRAVPSTPRPRSRAHALVTLTTVALAVLALAPPGARSGAAHAQRPSAPTLALGGDVIFDAPIAYAIDRFFDDATEAALRELVSELAPALGRADLAIVNLECPVAPRTHARDAEHDLPTFAAPPALLDALRDAGVDALTLANNHAYDQGVEGLASTLAEARRAGLAAIGAATDEDEAARPVVLRAAGRRVAIVAFTEGTNRRVRDVDPAAPRVALASASRVADAVRTAREAGDLAVVSFHWTTRLEDRRLERGPSRAMERLVRAAADAGADLIYAHGPHLPARSGTVESADGRRVPVLWSLGNLIAAMEEDDERVHAASPSVRDALIAEIRTRESTGGRLEVASIAAEPYWIASPQRAWWSAAGADAPPTSAMVRPLSIAGELARLERARCGERCDRWAASYRARARMLAALVHPDPDPVPDPLSEPVTDRPAARARPPAHPRASRPRDPDAPPIPADLARGVELRVTFAPGAAIVASHDAAQIRAIADLLLADRTLRVELVARGDPALALQRAHRARGLIAIRGPSRARFTLRAAPAERDALTLRLTR